MSRSDVSSGKYSPLVLTEHYYIGPICVKTPSTPSKVELWYQQLCWPLLLPCLYVYLKTDHDASKWILNPIYYTGKLVHCRLRLLKYFEFNLLHRPVTKHQADEFSLRLKNLEDGQAEINDEVQYCTVPPLTKRRDKYYVWARQRRNYQHRRCCFTFYICYIDLNGTWIP